MGGYGSGLYGSGTKSAKTVVEQCKSIDIRRWQRENLLVAKRFTTYWANSKGQETGSISVLPKQDYLILEYALDGEPVATEVCYDETLTGFGKRKWFMCPGCGDRCAVLYLKNKHFACRECQNLNYRSSQLSGDTAYYHEQLTKLCRELKAEYEPTSYFPPWKPKGMHWKTYEKHTKRYKQLAIKRDRAFIAGANMILNRKTS